jgi:hypothetical protein
MAESKNFALPPEDREQNDGGADVRDDQNQLQERSEEDAVVGAGTGDVAGGIVENRLKQIKRWDRGDEGDEEQHPRNQRNRSTRPHADPSSLHGNASVCPSFGWTVSRPTG